MAALATGNLKSTTISHQEGPEAQARELGSTALLEIVRACLHANPAEWIFLRELRVGTGFRKGAAQLVDAFALNCFAHTSMKRVCYEIKTSRADFFCEMKQPLKRRIGLRYSNEFYFITPAGLLKSSEIPIECGLVEIGLLTDEERNSRLTRAGAFVHFNVDHSTYCRVTVPAPWRETPGPTWQFVAGMLRNQQRGFQERPPKHPKQERLQFPD
jgi:hypothetical protein